MEQETRFCFLSRFRTIQTQITKTKMKRVASQKMGLKASTSRKMRLQTTLTATIRASISKKTGICLEKMKANGGITSMTESQAVETIVEMEEKVEVPQTIRVEIRTTMMDYMAILDMTLGKSILINMGKISLEKPAWIMTTRTLREIPFKMVHFLKTRA